jgi:hypothetical protein
MLPVNQTQPDDTSGQSPQYEVAETPSAHKMKSRSSRFVAFSVITKEVVSYVADQRTKVCLFVCLFVCLTAHQHKEVIRANTRCGCSLTSYPGRSTH